MNSFNVAVLVSLVALVGTSEACATAPPTSSTEGIEVVVVSEHEWDMVMNTAHTDTVVAEIKRLASLRQVVFFTATQVTKMPEMVGTKLGVHFEILGAFDKCLRVLEFFQHVVKTHATTAPAAPATAMDKITSATVKCGTFDTITVL
ncbi:hypothetical protein PRIPAC_72492 [Pristionchus pacificus]|uniref:Uncharacterized protein n=1 Tax=Pristionchus pacificus TaxID=54126 RepID=A0A2A6C7V1_PRIPA|nr:hypothetical protein PRIPAC_72492 [Pristionchus pacificus]|eukprot:PDM74180.1 hypothetical protein PRIPAC_41536 [Pristionchus pacificus]